MINSLVSTTICCVVSHGGPADHFATFLPDLQKMGAIVHVHATPGVIGKFKDFKDLGIEVDALCISDASISELDMARNLAKKCSKVSVLLTDLGNSFSISVQKTFKETNPQVKRLVYYDNPESYVPGGYSDIAEKTMQVADRVLFSNINLVHSPIYKNKKEEASIPFEKRYGIGYYPMVRAQEIRESRLKEKKTHSMRAKFFEEYQIQGKDKKVVVYFGGNNNEYYESAFPAFKKFLVESIKETDLSYLIFVIHQHPMAKNSNRDWNHLEDWIQEVRGNPKAPILTRSHWSLNQIQTIADCALYYQTSMAAQFALAGIPTIQIGHEMYEDILIKNRVIPSVISTNSFTETIIKGNYEENKSDLESLRGHLGIRDDYTTALVEAIK